MEYKGIKIDWLGHASFRLSNSAIVYIDPFKLEVGQPKADIILITHSHYDHCSLADIQRLLKPDTVVVGPVDTQSKVAKLAGNVDFRMVHPGEQVNVKGISISTLPAYNINKPYHPKENGWVGYLIEVSGVRVYHAGDSDATPELKSLQGIDVLLLPVGGTYTMTADEAAGVANSVNPGVAIPMHYGTIVGSRADAERFKQMARCRVEILGNI